MNTPKQIEQRIDQCITQIKNESIDDLALENMQKRIKIAVDNQAKKIANQNSKATVQPENNPFNLRTFINSFKTKIVYAGSSAFAVGLLSFLIIFSGSTQTAFAKVQQQLFNINTMSYQSTMFAQQNPIMQLNVWYKQPGSLRVETMPLTANSENAKSINVIDINQGKGLMLFPGAKVSVPFDFYPTQAVDPKDNPLHWFDIIKDYQGEVITLEKRLLNGEWLNGFLIKEAGLSITIWSNDTNNLPVEFAIYDGKTAETSNFHMQGELKFNQAINDSLFSLKAPDSYQLESED